jgi:hypothetical protein
MTAFSAAQVDTDQYKFGGASILLAASGLNDYVQSADHPDLDLGTSDFAIDCWVRFPSTPGGNVTIFGRTSSSSSYMYWSMEGGSWRFRDYNSGNIIDFSRSLSMVANTWYHVAVTRNGSNFRMFLNGVQQGVTYVNANAITARAVGIDIGCMTQNGAYQMVGWIDEFRYSVGDARWTSDFTPPIEEYSIEHFNDIDVDIRIKKLEFVDMISDIRAKFEEHFNDLDLDIRTKKEIIVDMISDIRAKFEEHFNDLDVDIRASKEVIEDINADIRVVEDIIKDIATDIRVSKYVIEDIETDIRIVKRAFRDIDTDIRVVHAQSLNRTIVEESPYFEEGYYLTSQDVTISMTKVYNAVKMQFKNEFGGTWSALETFSATKSWTLLAGDGSKRVYIRFMDVNGNLSDGAHFIDAVLVTTGVPTLAIEAYTDAGALTPILPSTYQTDKTPFFSWEIPEYAVPFAYFSYAIDGTPSDVMNLNIPAMVQSGMLISKVIPPPQMTLEAADGYYYYANDKKQFNSQSVTLDNGGAKDRIDVIYISATFGSLLIEKGIEADSPVVPDVDELDAILLAEVYVPAGTVDIASVTLTDIRTTHIDLNQYLTESLDNGQHILSVRAYTSVGTYSTSTFNIWVANDDLSIGEVKCYTDGTKLIELANGLYQTTDNTPYFEWDTALAEPGPIRYYYTEDGTEPDSGDLFLVTNSYTPGVYANGVTILKVKAYDVTTGYWGKSREFVFIYGSVSFTDDTAVISGNTILKQSLKEVHVYEISWDFNSARTCRFFQPVAFDATLPFSYGDTVCVVYGASNTTIFRGRIIQIERTIDIGQEGVTYHCADSRQELNEEYAYITNADFGDTAQISFEDTSISTAIATIISKYPNIVKKVESYPSGANITEEYPGQVVSSVLDSIYSKTKYLWYMKPDGSLVSIDLSVTNPGQAKFGIYGTTVNAISPQYNVMASNLQFDITSRYNRCIIEGAKKLERVMLPAHCASSELLDELLGSDETSWDARFKLYQIDSKWAVVKIIKTYVSYARLLGYQVQPRGAGGRLGFGDSISGFYLVFLNMEVAKDNVLMTRNRDLQYGNFAPEGEDPDMRWVGFTNWEYSRSELPQGSLGPSNTIRFSKSMWHMWPVGAREDNATGVLLPAEVSLSSVGYGAIAYSWRDNLKPECAFVRADVLISTVPLRVDVSVAGTASSLSKILRIVNTSFKYSEDPDDLVDDTARMTQYAQDLLQKYKDVKVNGTITLDTIDLTWDLDKTVNLINTDQASWASLNAKVIGIKYDFDMNTTTLEITSEFLK